MGDQKKKCELEFLLRTSSRILYNHLITPSGLSEWFADDVRVMNDTYTFVWEGNEEEAELIGQKKNEYARFHWTEDEDEKTFFEFRIRVDSLTNEVALIITDHVEAGEEEEIKELWESQVQRLREKLGA